MKKVVLSVVIICMTFMSNGQLRVTSNGNIGIGTTTPNRKLVVNGNIGLEKNGHSMFLTASNPQGEIGSSTGKVSFYWNGHNQVHAQLYNVASDMRLKTNIAKLDNSLETISKLRTYSYQFKSDVKNGIDKMQYGFMSQEVQEFLPGIVDSSHGVLLMCYDQIIPFLVNGMQEQIKTINELEEKIIELENSLGTSSAKETIKNKATILHQNSPNPFKERTIIKFDIPEDYLQASIMIFDMKGTLLETYSINDKTGEVTIEGRKFKAGMYAYSLVIDNTEIDTKRMILIK